MSFLQKLLQKSHEQFLKESFLNILKETLEEFLQKSPEELLEIPLKISRTKHRKTIMRDALARVPETNSEIKSGKILRESLLDCLKELLKLWINFLKKKKSNFGKNSRSISEEKNLESFFLKKSLQKILKETLGEFLQETMIKNCRNLCRNGRHQFWRSS